LRAVRLEQERKGVAAAYDSRTIHVMPYWTDGTQISGRRSCNLSSA
jgi:hypothetical protein